MSRTFEKKDGGKRLLDISAFDEWTNEACENAKLFKEKSKTLHG